ncbi:acyl-CoA thioesterase [Thiotrichales bacterium 19S3-7]|nr:acyl-CoA thioesterase [Thiotrichales bacterium 19S3-7]MCF6803043.1 acyl-CoA thioesterase [Thiotrichales bacterium 19S3-11]
MREYSFKTPIRWMDMDAYGHVNNGRYCDFMVEARFHWFNQLSCLKDWIKKDQIQFVMVKQTIEYIKPFTFPGDIEVVQLLKRIGRSSVELDYSLNLVSDYCSSYAKAYAKLVAYSLLTKSSIAIPEQIKQQLLEVAKN